MIKTTTREIASSSDVNAPVFYFEKYVRGRVYHNNGRRIDFVTDGDSLYVPTTDNVTAVKDAIEEDGGFMRLVSKGKQGIQGIKGDPGHDGRTPSVFARFDGRQMIFFTNDVEEDGTPKVDADGNPVIKRIGATNDLTGPSWRPKLIDNTIIWEKTRDDSQPESIDLTEFVQKTTPVILRVNSDNTKRSDETSGPANYIQWKYEGDEYWNNLISISELMNLTLAGVAIWKNEDGEIHFGHREVIKAEYTATHTGKQIITDVELGDILFDAGKIPFPDYTLDIELMKQKLCDMEAELANIPTRVSQLINDVPYATAEDLLHYQPKGNYQPAGNYLTEHQPIKSINGTPVAGYGNFELLTPGDLDLYAKKTEIPDAYTKAESNSRFQPAGNYLTEHQRLKTINGQSLVGNGNITIEGGSSVDLSGYVKSVNGNRPDANGNVSISVAGNPIMELKIESNSLYKKSVNDSSWQLVGTVNGSGSGDGISETRVRELISNSLNDYYRKAEIDAIITDLRNAISGGSVTVSSYRTFMVYQWTESRSTIPSTNQIEASWDSSNSGNLIFTNKAGWEDHPGNEPSGKPYLWMTSCTFTSNGGVKVGNWATPICLSGPDGVGVDGTSIEFIYTLCDNESDFASISSTIPTGVGGRWTDHPSGISKANPIEAASVRTKVDDVWTQFCAPFIWSRWGEDGLDGDGVEYIFARSATDTLTYNSQFVNPSNINTTVSGFQESDYTPTGWSDEPIGVNVDYPYEFISIRRYAYKEGSTTEKEWGKFTVPVVWAHYGKNGQDGTSFKPRIFIITTSTDYLNCNAQWTTDLASYNSEAVVGDTCLITVQNAQTKLIEYTEMWAYTGENPGVKNCEEGLVYGWQNCGTLKGDPGTDGLTSYVHQKYANESSSGTSTTVYGEGTVKLAFTPIESPFTKVGELPGKYVGMYTDFTEEDSENLSDYRWRKWSGDDGFGMEQIFIVSNEKPIKPTWGKCTSVELNGETYAPGTGNGLSETIYNTYDAVPTIKDGNKTYVWKDVAQETDVNNKICWVSVRKLDIPHLKEWSDPVNFSNYAEDGKDGKDGEGASPYTLDFFNDNLSVYVGDSNTNETVIDSAFVVINSSEGKAIDATYLAGQDVYINDKKVGTWSAINNNRITLNTSSAESGLSFTVNTGTYAPISGTSYGFGGSLKVTDSSFDATNGNKYVVRFAVKFGNESVWVTASLSTTPTAVPYAIDVQSTSSAIIRNYGNQYFDDSASAAFYFGIKDLRTGEYINGIPKELVTGTNPDLKFEIFIDGANSANYTATYQKLGTDDSYSLQFPSNSGISCVPLNNNYQYQYIVLYLKKENSTGSTIFFEKSIECKATSTKYGIDSETITVVTNGAPGTSGGEIEGASLTFGNVSETIHYINNRAIDKCDGRTIITQGLSLAKNSDLRGKTLKVFLGNTEKASYSFDACIATFHEEPATVWFKNGTSRESLGFSFSNSPVLLGMKGIGTTINGINHWMVQVYVNLRSDNNEKIITDNDSINNIEYRIVDSNNNTVVSNTSYAENTSAVEINAQVVSDTAAGPVYPNPAFEPYGTVRGYIGDFAIATNSVTGATQLYMYNSVRGIGENLGQIGFSVSQLLQLMYRGYDNTVGGRQLNLCPIALNSDGDIYALSNNGYWENTGLHATSSPNYSGKPIMPKNSAKTPE